MKNPTQLRTLSLYSTYHFRRRLPSRWRILAILGLAGFMFAPVGRAVMPPPDGGYPNANTAEGDQALYSLTTGADNTAVGFNALFSNTTGSSNTSIGFYSMPNNTTGSFNTAHGQFALQSNGAGIDNTAVGYNALFNNTTGNSNAAVGASAGVNLTTGSANIDIGNKGVAGDSKTIRLGTVQTHRATYIAGINGAPVADGISVVIGADGRLGTVASSRRFKDEIKPMDKASEAILALQPVTFRYKHELDPKGVPQFGLVAEQVEKVNSALVARDDRGKPYTVRYEAVNAMLLNEFLKEHRKVEELVATVAQLRASLKEQAAQIHNVRQEVELSRLGPQMIANNQ